MDAIDILRTFLEDEAHALRIVAPGIAKDLQYLAEHAHDMGNLPPDSAFCPYCEPCHLWTHWDPQFREQAWYPVEHFKHPMIPVREVCPNSIEYKLYGYRVVWKCLGPECGVEEER